MKRKLEELKQFRTNLNPETIFQFDSLIESIKKELSESYRSKLSILNLYSTEDKQNDDDDLPF